MNKDMIKKNKGHHVLLVPPACRLDKYGFELPPATDDDWWLIESVEDDGVTIKDPRSGHFMLLGYDHIYKYTSDGVKAGASRGLLSLHVQLTIQANDVRVIPNARPGEPVHPKKPEVHEVEVDLSWPDKSGLQKRLASEGYTLGWTHRARGNGLIASGTHERVMEADGRGGFSTFKTPDGMILLQHRSLRSGGGGPAHIANGFESGGSRAAEPAARVVPTSVVSFSGCTSSSTSRHLP